jgi:hypothetical protein
MRLAGGIAAWMLLVQVSVGVAAADSACVHHDQSPPPPSQHHEHDAPSNEGDACTMHLSCSAALELDVVDVEAPTIAFETDGPIRTLPAPRSAIRAPEPPPPKA